MMGPCDPGPATTDSQRQWLLGAGAMWASAVMPCERDGVSRLRLSIARFSSAAGSALFCLVLAAVAALVQPVFDRRLPCFRSIASVRAASLLARHTRLRPSLTPLSWSSCVLPLMVVRWRLLVEGMSCVAMDGRIWLTEGFLQLRGMSCVVLDDGVCARVGMSARVRQ